MVAHGFNMGVPQTALHVPYIEHCADTWSQVLEAVGDPSKFSCKSVSQIVSVSAYTGPTRPNIPPFRTSGSPFDYMFKG